jgi:hypothetical protein
MMAQGYPGRLSNMALYGKDSVRLRFGDGNIVPGVDPEMDKLYERIKKLPRGTKFRTVATWLLTGAMMEEALPPDQVDAMKQAADQIMANFVFDEG